MGTTRGSTAILPQISSFSADFRAFNHPLTPGRRTWLPNSCPGWLCTDERALFNRDVQAHSGQLRVFAFFHLNLAFSSIEEERRAEVIARCYWPLLRLAEKHAHIGIEVSGYTLEEIARHDPAWIAQARRLIAENKIELIGSGYSQMIGPLVPARVIAENLRIGNEVYRDLLGARPAVALVNEQAFSAGLVEHYLDAGYSALLMDWDNPSANHPEWDAERQYLPQYAAGLGAQNRPVVDQHRRIPADAALRL